MVTNAVLGGVADTVAQTITSIRERALRKGINAREDPLAIEIHELDRKNPVLDRELIPESKALPPPFDFERLTRFMAYGFAMAPLQFKWFSFLERCFPITKTSAFMPAMKRVVMDQLVFAPFGKTLPQDNWGVRLLTAGSVHRYCMLLHRHDRCRGWRSQGGPEQAPGYVRPHTEGQLHGLASGADYQLPLDARAIPTGRWLIAPFALARQNYLGKLTRIFHSLLSLPSVLLGPPISP